MLTQDYAYLVESSTQFRLLSLSNHYVRPIDR